MDGTSAGLFVGKDIDGGGSALFPLLFFRRTFSLLLCMNEPVYLSLSHSDVHTEAVQAVLARHVERKVAVPMPSKRRSLVVQTSMDAYTPPGDDTQTETHTCICPPCIFLIEM